MLPQGGHMLSRPLWLGAACLLVMLVQILHTSGWQEDVRPLQYVRLGEDDVLKFLGNQSHKDHFKLLEKDRDSLLVGARNIVYNISLRDLQERMQQRIEWHSTSVDRDLCIMKGKSESDCQNYIRVLAKIDKEQVLICGTNSYNPKCRIYKFEEGAYLTQNEFKGKCSCPYDPDHNSTAIYVGSQLYAATVADFVGSDPLIYRDPFRTVQYDLKHLNAPNFVNSLAEGDYVFFFFRETAVEYINCGKTVYSRVGRVCKSDKGGPKRFQNQWTSFLKSRLNCSIPGEFPFYFDEIQSTSDIVEGKYGSQNTKLIYGVFTTPTNALSGSAVCAFKLQDILDTFEGPFKEQETINSNWLPVLSKDVPDPRPGLCFNDSRTLPDVTLNFIKSHSLMDEAVPIFFQSPLIIRTSFQYRFTKIAVDPQVVTTDGKAYDVMFIGTDDGKVLKAINSDSWDKISHVSPVIIEEIQVFPSYAAVKNLYIVRTSERVEDNKLIVVSDDEIQAVKLQRCYSDQVTSCSECVALQDPYCAWDRSRHRCVTNEPSYQGASFIQNVATGTHSACPTAVDVAIDVTEPTTSDAPVMTCAPCVCPEVSTSSNKNNLNTATGQDVPGTGIADLPSNSKGEDYDEEIETNEIVIEFPERNDNLAPLPENNHAGPSFSAAHEASPIYSTETLAIAVTTSCVAALVVGFISGFLFSRRCQGEEYVSSYNEAPYMEQQHRLNRLTHEASMMNHTDPNFISSNNKSINLVLNVPPKSSKNANSAADNKPVQKVKKVYL